MKLIFTALFLALLFACNTGPANNAAKDSALIITNDTIPVIRQKVNSNAIASYTETIENSLNNWVFSAKVYETKETFHYLLKLQYEELRATDTLKIPNFGTYPKIEIKKGPTKYSCIIGFIDKKNVFKEYKLVSAKDDKLKVTILKRYGVTTYN